MDSSKKPQKENPRKNANFLSVFLITWIWPLLYTGSKKGLTQEDLTKTLPIDESEKLGDELERRWKTEQEKCKRKKSKPCLRNTMIKTYYKQVLLNGLLMYLFISAKTCVPIILAQLLKCYQNSPITESDNTYKSNNTVFSPSTNNDNGTTPESSEYFSYYIVYIWNDKICLTTLLVLISFIGVSTYHNGDLRQKMLGSRMRSACCSAVYRKTLRLSKKKSEEASVGYVVNLLSNDVARLNTAFVFIHYIWIAPVQSIIICYILYNIVGAAAFVGVIALILKLVPVHSFLAKLAAKLRLKVAVRTDKRVGIMNELINGILVVKMYTWEKPFQAVVAEVRRLEIKKIRYVVLIFGLCSSSFLIVERSTLFVTLVAMLYLNIPITANVVFAAALYFSLLQHIVAVGSSLALALLAEGLVSVKRIEKFLILDEHDPGLHGVVMLNNSEIQQNQPILEINNVVASWTDSKTPTLNCVTFNALAGKLCAIVGPVGSGKSSLLQTILGELAIKSGEIVVKGKISYGSQEPWLFSDTVKNNIIFGQTFDKKRYHEVIKCCALTTDLKQLAYGDKTIVGDRGASLSGGQKARISLARAVYKMADIYLFDDPLSAVDTHVGHHLYNEVIGPKGCLAKHGAARILVTHQTHFLKDADWIIIINNGTILHQGTYEEHANNGLDFMKLLKNENIDKKIEIEENGLMNEESEEALFIDTEKDISSISPRASFTKSTQSLCETPEVIAETKAQGTVSFNVWARYFRGGGSLCYLFYAAFLFVFSQVMCSVCDYFVNIWTRQEYLRINNLPTMYTTNECLYIYTALIVGAIFFILLRCYTFFLVCMRASKTLHNSMFSAILHAPMRFFETNPAGQILNRFSSDMGNVDELFPRSVWGTLQYSLKMFGIFAVVIAVNPKLLVVLGGAIILYILLVAMYLPAAQDLKRLEGIVRSPVVGHLGATLNGLTTIRVNNVQKLVSKEFDELQNVHTNSWQLIHGANSTLAIWLDIISCAFVGFVAFSFILINENTFAGNVGLVLSQSLSLTEMLQHGIRQTTETLQLMTCVERIVEYCDVKPEQSKTEKPSAKWPEHGKIVFDDMSYSYDKNLPPVLNNIKININSGWKVGIVGRTGAGKTSLIGALFQLAHIDGKIIIDDIDTNNISLESLRQNITIIPQDPVLFSATIRYNLDPFGWYTDEQLWKVLDEVELNGKIAHLDCLVTEGGCNFSVGERQLLCLARAILRNNKIFILDEATANVDLQTDKLIQKTVRIKFANCTVLTIAHRLNTIMDSDRILVIDAGVVKEFDTPHNLLQCKTGYFSDMVAATGETESNDLRRMADRNLTKFELNKE